ncbi:MAG: lytic transglycosylase domain-containing protein [Marmoricola sp.]
MLTTIDRRRAPARLLAGCLLAGLLGAGGTLVLAGPAAATPWPGHPGRHLVAHTVRPGETATGLAVRFHAWTRELIRLNHLGRGGSLYVGQRIRIPVVDVAHRRHRTRHDNRHHTRHHVTRHHVTHAAATRAERLRRSGWRGFDLSRAQVRRLIVRSAHRHGVPPTLALAIAWQESGWQQPLISPAGAIGVMQLLPATGRWMSLYAGKRLHLRHARDNIHGGVELLRVLRASTRRNVDAIAAYYQGLGAVRAHGWYDDTVGYVRSVRAIRHRLRHGLAP